jgi:hypothetical protein
VAGQTLQFHQHTTPTVAAAAALAAATHLELNVHAHRQLSSSSPHVPVVPLELQRLCGIPLTQLFLVANNLELLAIANLCSSRQMQSACQVLGYYRRNVHIPLAKFLLVSLQF